jgi:glycosyltransferase 2 family protein
VNQAPEPESAHSLTARFRRWLAWSVALAALGWIAWSLYVGVEEVGSALGRFGWRWFFVAVGLTLVGNYALRWLKWHWLLGRLGVRVPVGESALIFVAGLAMVISPGKAGELLKPWLVRERTGAAMATTIPALITERLTDGMAALIIAAVSVSKFAGDSATFVYGTIGVALAGVLVLMHEGLSLTILGGIGRLRPLRRFAGKLEELYRAMRLCLAPWPLLVTLFMSIVAWGAECWGYQLLWRGFGREVSLEASSFLYAFATAAGGISPGGLGVADGMLATLPIEMLGLPGGEVAATSMLIRGATLWLGVLLGALALLAVDPLLRRPRAA